MGLIIIFYIYYFLITKFCIDSTLGFITIPKILNRLSNIKHNKQYVEFTPNATSMSLFNLKDREKNLLDNLKQIREAKSEILKQHPLHIGIIGFGNYGQYLAKKFRKKGHSVSALSRKNYQKKAEEFDIKIFTGLSYPNDECPWPTHNENMSFNNFFDQDNLDIIVISVSILSFENVVKKISKRLLNKDILVVDVLSVKTHPKAILVKKLPESCDILCTHPMFGPESAPDSWKDMKLVYDYIPNRAKNIDRIEKYLSIFDEEGCNMIQMDSKDHDVNSANSQFATHLIGRVLQQLDLQSTTIDTKSFEKMMEIKKIVSDDSFDLFYGLYKYNPNSINTLLLIQKALLEIEIKLTKIEFDDNGIEGWKLDDE